MASGMFAAKSQRSPIHSKSQFTLYPPPLPCVAPRLQEPQPHHHYDGESSGRAFEPVVSLGFGLGGNRRG